MKIRLDFSILIWSIHIEACYFHVLWRSISSHTTPFVQLYFPQEVPMLIPAQSRVAGMLACGVSVLQTARVCGVSRSTPPPRATSQCQMLRGHELGSRPLRHATLRGSKIAPQSAVRGCVVSQSVSGIAQIAWYGIGWPQKAHFRMDLDAGCPEVCQDPPREMLWSRKMPVFRCVRLRTVPKCSSAEIQKRGLKINRPSHRCEGRR